MKYSSDLLYGLARAAPVAELDGSEQEIIVPHVLVPHVRLPGAIIDFSGFVATAVQRESFATAIRVGLAASGATSTDRIATFGRGLWRLHITFSTLANFTQASDGTRTGNTIAMRDPVGNISSIMKLYQVNGVPQLQDRVFDVLFTRDEWALQQTVENTGIGQTNEAQTGLLASRLL